MDEFAIGSTVQLELSNEVLIGTLVCVDAPRNIIELDNVKELDTGCCIKGKQMFSLKQVLSIRAIENAANDTTANSSVCSDNVPSMSTTDVEIIFDQIKNMVYIKYADEKYHRALNDIKAQAEVGVCFEPSSCDGRSRTSLIGIATHTAVYIFDMQTLGQLCCELKSVLQSRKPRKVVHSIHLYVKKLRAMGLTNVITNGIFDTSVAYCIAAHVKKPLDFKETIYECFGIIPKLLSHDSYPYRRPLSPHFLEIVAKRAIWLLKLQQYLVHEKLLTGFYNKCQELENLLSKIDNSEYVASHEEPIVEVGEAKVITIE